MARVVVDVVLKPEILDPQGQAILGALIGWASMGCTTCARAGISSWTWTAPSTTRR